MGSAIYLLSALLVMGDGTQPAGVQTDGPGAAFGSVQSELQDQIAKSNARLPTPKLPVMTGSQPKVRVLTASEQKPAALRPETRVQRWTF